MKIVSNQLKINYTRTNDFVSVFIKGNIFVIQRTDPRYTAIIDALISGDFELVHKYIDPTIALNLAKLTIKDSIFFWNGIQLPINFYKIFLFLVSKNRSLLPYLHFILDNLENSQLDRYINFFVSNSNCIIPYDMSGKFFVTRSKYVTEYPAIIKYVEDDSIDDIKESTYFDYLESKFGKGMISFLKKEEKPFLINFISLYPIVKSFEYSMEDLLWCYKKILPNIGNNKINFKSLSELFKTFTRFKNWVNKSNYAEMKEISDFLRIDGIKEFKNELFDQSGSFSELLRLIMDSFAKINFKSKIIYFNKPSGLKKFSYTFYKKNIRYDIHFAKSNYDLYSWGLMFHNCAAGYTQSVIAENNLVFIIEINGEKLIIGDLSARTIDGFVGKINGKTVVKKKFDSWDVRQFKLSYNNETTRYKDESIKLLKSLGLIINYKFKSQKKKE